MTIDDEIDLTVAALLRQLRLQPTGTEVAHTLADQCGRANRDALRGTIVLCLNEQLNRDYRHLEQRWIHEAMGWVPILGGRVAAFLTQRLEWNEEAPGIKNQNADLS